MEQKSLFTHFKDTYTTNYSNFKGRARRREYWGTTLWNIIMSIPITILAVLLIITGSVTLKFLTIGLLTLLTFAILIPSIAVCVRRLHDTGRSGWWLLIGFIPSMLNHFLTILMLTTGSSSLGVISMLCSIVGVVGGIVLIVFYCLDSEAGENKYGANPKEVEA